MNITITHLITFSPEAISLLEKLLGGRSDTPVKETGKVKKLPVDKTDPITPEVTDPTLSVDSGKVDSLKGEVNSTSTTDEPVTLEILRAAVNAQAQAGKKEGIKATLAKFGTAKVTEVDKAKYPEFLTAINAL